MKQDLYLDALKFLVIISSAIWIKEFSIDIEYDKIEKEHRIKIHTVTDNIIFRDTILKIQREAETIGYKMYISEIEVFDNVLKVTFVFYRGDSLKK